MRSKIIKRKNKYLERVREKIKNYCIKRKKLKVIYDRIVHDKTEKFKTLKIFLKLQQEEVLLRKKARKKTMRKLYITKINKKIQLNKRLDVSVKNLIFINVHAHLGSEIKMLNKEMKSYLLGTRLNFHLLNIDITMMNFNKLKASSYELIKTYGNFIYITESEFFDYYIKKIADQIKTAYSFKKWIAGILHHKKIIQAVGLTKIGLDNKVNSWKVPAKLEKLFSKLQGVGYLSSLPQLAFFITPFDSQTALGELKKNYCISAGLVESKDIILNNIDLMIVSNNRSKVVHCLYASLLAWTIQESQLNRKQERFSKLFKPIFYLKKKWKDYLKLFNKTKLDKKLIIKKLPIKVINLKIKLNKLFFLFKKYNIATKVKKAPKFKFKKFKKLFNLILYYKIKLNNNSNFINYKLAFRRKKNRFFSKKEWLRG